MESELNSLISAKNMINYVFFARVEALETTFGAPERIAHSSRRSRRGLASASPSSALSVFISSQIRLI